MEPSTYDKILQFASDLLNAVREFLATQLNIELPMWLAQAMVLVLFLPILYQSVKTATKSRKTGVRLTAWAASIAVAAVSLMIVVTWITYWQSPLLEQVEGEVTGLTSEMRAESLQVALLDFRGESLGARVSWLSGTTHFLLNYTPEFADPPAKISIKGGGCKSERRPRRSELTRGAIISIALECGPGP
jgi:hypothetical protein